MKHRERSSHLQDKSAEYARNSSATSLAPPQKKKTKRKQIIVQFQSDRLG